MALCNNSAVKKGAKSDDCGICDYEAHKSPKKSFWSYKCDIIVTFCRVFRFHCYYTGFFRDIQHRRMAEKRGSEKASFSWRFRKGGEGIRRKNVDSKS